MLFAILIYATKKGLPLSVKQRIFINQERGQLMANETAIENDEPLPYPQRYEHVTEIKTNIDFISEKLHKDVSFHEDILNHINEVLI